MEAFVTAATDTDMYGRNLPEDVKFLGISPLNPGKRVLYRRDEEHTMVKAMVNNWEKGEDRTLASIPATTAGS